MKKGSLNRTKLIVVTAPSGAGKTTIVQHLIKTFPRLAFSVSATNRPRRENEVDGKHYYFLSTDEFQKRLRNEEFLEWEEVYDGQYYGTLRSEVERLGKADKDIIFDIDVRGAMNIKARYPEALTVFVKPPSLEELIRRLSERGSESAESLKKRIEKATYELTFENRFDEVLLNDDKEVALKEAELLYKNFIGHDMFANTQDEGSN